jgi:hypothetical protein
VRHRSDEPARFASSVRFVLAFGTVLIVASSCNDLFGLEAGRPKSSGDADTGGLSGTTGEAGDGGVGGTGGTGGRPGVGGEAGRAGTSGASGESGGRGGSGARAGSGGASAGSAGTAGGAGAGEAGMGGTGGSPCTSNEECRQRGVDWPHLCRSGACVDITTDDCDLLYTTEDPFLSKEPFIFGAFTNVDPMMLGVDPFFSNVNLAMREFANEGGLPIVGEQRPILVVVCHDPNGYLDVQDRAMDHLIGTARVPGIFMMTDAHHVEHAAERAFEERGEDVLLFHRGGPHPSLERFSDDGRVWHALANQSNIDAVFAPLVERVEEHVDSNRSGPTRLVVHPGAIDESLLASLRVNDAPVLDQLDRNVFLVQMQFEASRVIAELEPDIVLSPANPMIALDIDAAARANGSPPPFHVLVGDKFTYPPELYRDALDRDPTLRTRLVGVKTASADDRSVRASYGVRVRAVTPARWKIEDTEHMYDLAYFMFYAAVAASTEAEVRDGRGLRDGMRRLGSGDRYNVGPAGIPDVLERLQRDPDTPLALYGTMGTPDFDLSTGNRTRFGNVWCVDENLAIVDDAMKYDPSSGTLSVEAPCFEP